MGIVYSEYFKKSNKYIYALYKRHTPIIYTNFKNYKNKFIPTYFDTDIY